MFFLRFVISALCFQFLLFVVPHPTTAAAFIIGGRHGKRSLAFSLAESSSSAEGDNDKFAQWRRNDLFGNSLVEETLLNLESERNAATGNEELSLAVTATSTKDKLAMQRRSLHKIGVPSFASFVTPRLQRRSPTILQLNIGLYCNQACAHCHVESSPLRTESMTSEIAAQCLSLLKSTPSITTLDITGGAPELNANFRYLVQMARAMRPDLIIIDRCNLTVLQEPGQEDLVDFLKSHKVRIVASLPCYTQETVNQQRGRGVFERSIAALIALNDAGYGISNELQLNLVFNPQGASLPPNQQELQIQYKEHLKENFGILFNELYAMANMPIKRFADYLHRRGELQTYMELLVQNFNAETVDSVMCVDTVSVGWDGKVYDCDFNQQLGYTAGDKGLTVFDLETLDLSQYAIQTDKHCFGCTAGMGSSCQGTTAP
jgi:radical SAM/Cys-rich protein